MLTAVIVQSQREAHTNMCMPHIHTSDFIPEQQKRTLVNDKVSERREVISEFMQGSVIISDILWV